jgi:hypothetical protein
MRPKSLRSLPFRMRLCGRDGTPTLIQDNPIIIISHLPDSVMTHRYLLIRYSWPTLMEIRSTMLRVILRRLRS